MAFYQGETMNFKATFSDYEGSLSSYTITALIYTKLYSGGVIEVAQSSMTIDNTSGIVSFSLTPSQTAQLQGVCVLEIKVVNSGETIIGQETSAFTVLKTKIHSY